MNRIDAHQHFWTVARGDYGWLTPALAPLYRDFALADLKPLAAAANVVGTVLVQAAPTESETRFMLDIAHGSQGFVRGVVGWVDFERGDAPARMAALAQDKLLKGVRPMLHDIADADWVLRKEFAPALRAIVALGLRFDALVKPPHLPRIATLIERHPDLPLLVDHGAKPVIVEDKWQPWADDIARIAQARHVRCKLSGLVTEDGPNWSVDRLRRYVDHLLECFGPERMVWGSDWPVATLRARYGDWIAACDTLLAALPERDRRKIFHDNAVDFYDL
jgi:L-fuconolactonase